MTIAALVTSLVVAFLVLPRWSRDMLELGLVRVNYRGASVAFPLGALLVAASLIALAPLAVLNDRAGLSLLEPELGRWMVYVLGIALLGLLDDLLGRGSEHETPRGWRGHAGAVLSGRLSTGAIKAVGALALAAYATSGRGLTGLDYVADLLLLLLVTNLFNLLDLRPGRVEKALLLLLVGLCLGAWSVYPVELTGLFLGPVAVGAWLTLRERAMLGDTGSNLAGAVGGVALLVSLGDTARLVALAVALALTVYGEVRSISRAVDRLPPLRALDSLGRRR